ncbi:MAG: type II toxin-antitoxin system VapC family toxin [Terriglobales bacterium]
MVAIDTNLLVYAFEWSSPEHQRARDAVYGVAEAGRGFGVALAVAAEFWNVVTRPLGTRPRASAAEACLFLEKLEELGAQIWSPLPGFGPRLIRSARAEGIAGRRIFDWQIALTAIEHGATELWTHDHSFRAPAGLRVIDPLG